jgi:hypothetical protein
MVEGFVESSVDVVVADFHPLIDRSPCRVDLRVG